MRIIATIKIIFYKVVLLSIMDSHKRIHCISCGTMVNKREKIIIEQAGRTKHLYLCGKHRKLVCRALANTDLVDGAYMPPPGQKKATK